MKELTSSLQVILRSAIRLKAGLLAASAAEVASFRGWGSS